MAPIESMPDYVQDSADQIQEAYRFAVANPQTADAIPCYCGCSGLGHTSSYDCFVAGRDEMGLIAFDAHAASCAVCVDIILDTMHLLDEGQSSEEIMTQIESDYARFGPPTIKTEPGASS